MADAARLPWWQATGSLQLKILLCLIAVIWLPLLLKGLWLVSLVPSLNACTFLTNNLLNILFLHKSSTNLRCGEHTWGKSLSLIQQTIAWQTSPVLHKNDHFIIFGYVILHTVLLVHNGWYFFLILLLFYYFTTVLQLLITEVITIYNSNTTTNTIYSY